ncbi:MAG: DUF4331 family protein [Myxococcales bacterium]|nr:DUF4331 family protein [Myxococcales bacterium]
MNKRWLMMLALPLAAASASVLTPTRAADHLDSEGPVADPTADIADVYTWMSGPGRVALVMTVGGPLATASTRFSDAVDYRFAIKNVAKADGAGFVPVLGPSRDIVCTFDAGAPQTVTCRGAGGAISKTFKVGDPAACAAADDMCVWAGLRADPFFFDLAAFNRVPDAGAGAFREAGADDFFKNSRVLAIVVDVDAAKLLATDSFDAGPDASATPVVAVAAETVRR